LTGLNGIYLESAGAESNVFPLPTGNGTNKPQGSHAFLPLSEKGLNGLSRCGKLSFAALHQALGELARQRSDMRVILAQPRGFCAGVVRAIDIVEKALDKFGEPVYVRHEIVHNKHVVNTLKNKGARFVEELDEVPEGAVTVFSAHGVPQSVVKTAEDRGLPVLDATCPLVSKVHNQGKRYVSQGRTLILIGHAGHPEVEGTMGQVGAPVHLVQSEADVPKLPIPLDCPVAYITQTTLSIDDTKGIIVALKKRFRDIVGPETSDICYATQNRQTSVRELAKVADVILVVGAKNSSNSNRLREIGIEEGVPSYLINDGSELDPSWVRGKEVVGLTAGASAPESLVQDVIDALGAIEPVDVEQMDGKKEHIEFRLPVELRA
jgi:4-hydroxy-3-methylbut-2-enyl diphosphate reductase